MIEDWIHYFSETDRSITPSFEGGDEERLIHQVSYFHDQSNIDVSGFDVAIIGVPDARHSVRKGASELPDIARTYLYGLRQLSKSMKILDLGNLLGKTVDDRYSALQDVVAELCRLNVFPLVIGGGQDYTIPMSKAIKRINQNFRLAIIDSKIDWVASVNDFSSDGFLSFLCNNEERIPQDISVIGVQKYLLGQKQEDFIKQYSFDFLRLGEIRRKGICCAEPWLRDADLVSLDMTSVKQGDQPAHVSPMPNGFRSEDVCQLAWYSGLSDKLMAFGLFELDVQKDNQSQGVALSAQVIWHLLEGISLRYNDYPKKEIDEYKQFIVHLEDYEQDIKFYQNQNNDRWWVEVPVSHDQTEIVACDKSDFEKASQNDIPERWFRFIRKMK
ncbi:arginase family protein [Carboxylicivirga sp. N1Y90]|uniref:arginase family protein n=1 Tax=Carboxylicivirga fragile TaxID=3417571 RepID=UPI003D33D9B7|nr:arginase family protein [Marinilabiliaceae bacterium N1Y90]